jgi:hypothetical protein
MTLHVLLLAAGVFTLALGAVHIVLPALLDYHAVVFDRPAAWKPRPFRLWLTRYVVTQHDRYGIIWVMNFAASYVLLSVGLADLFAADWLRSNAGRGIALWIAGWWIVRAVSQLWLGRRRGDVLLVAWFLALAALHAVVAWG